MLLLPTDQPKTVQVVFPVVGKPILNPEFFDQPIDYRLFTTGKGLDWLYHLSIARRESGQVNRSSLPDLSIETIQQIVEILQEKEGGCGGTFEIHARECFHGSQPFCQGGCQGRSYHPANRWAGRSHELALATGIFAAGRGETIPPWVLLSSAVCLSTLQLEGASELVHKIHLALGRECGAEYVNPLVSGMYQRDRQNTEACIGREQDRVLPGKVKLFITGPCNFKELTRAFPKGEEISLDLFAHRGTDPERLLEDCVQPAAQDGMLVVPVQTLADALGLLAMRSSSRPSIQRVPAYRIPLDPEHSLDSRTRRRCTYLIEVYQELRKAKPSPEECLSSILRLCRLELNRILARDNSQARCFSGDIAVVPNDPQRRDWLRVEATDGGDDASAIPYCYPSTIGITRRVLATRSFQSVPDTSSNPDYASAKSENNPISRDRVYRPEVISRYLDFLDLIKSCIKLPVFDGDEVIAVLSLHCNHPVSTFDEKTITLLFALSQRLREPILLMRGRDDLGRNPSEEEPGSYNRVIRQSNSGSVVTTFKAFEERRKLLCQELALLARNRAGAYRTCVRSVSPDRTQLQVEAEVGEYSPSFRTKEHRLGSKNPSAANAAVHNLQHIYIEDTERQDAPIEPIGPIEARAHAGILVLCGSHILGVLSVDWDRPRQISGALRDDLEQLACRYAIAWKAFLIDAGLSELRRSQGNPVDVIRSTCEMLGSRYGALYVREGQTYELLKAACYGHSPDWRDEVRAGYSEGEGFVGWVATQNTPLRIANIHDEKELNAFHPVPGWRDRQQFEQEWSQRVGAWLGVPVRRGGKVFGVLRCASESPGKEGFGAFDQTVAEVAASYLARQYAIEHRVGVCNRAEKLIAKLRQHNVPENLLNEAIDFFEDELGVVPSFHAVEC